MEAVENSMFSHFTQEDLAFDVAFQQPNSYFRLVVLDRIRWIDRVTQGMITLVKDSRNKGYAIQACSLIINEAVKKLNLRKISCAVLEGSPSEKMLVKLGFLVEGLLIDERYLNGKWQNGVILSWMSGRDKLPEV
jgi:RimJ/RimL family protein N-acetyltransferase